MEGPVWYLGQRIQMQAGGPHLPTPRYWAKVQPQAHSSSHGFPVYELTCLLTFICKPPISTGGTFEDMPRVLGHSEALTHTYPAKDAQGIQSQQPMLQMTSHGLFRIMVFVVLYFLVTVLPFNNFQQLLTSFIT